LKDKGKDKGTVLFVLEGKTKGRFFLSGKGRQRDGSKIERLENGVMDDSLLDETKIGRRRACADKEVAAMLLEICGSQSVSDFQKLLCEEQKRTVLLLRADGVPYRQITRLTGISKGSIVNWCKKRLGQKNRPLLSTFV
jgi:DNA invertase Pin-like site-specific DNA recombinase